MVDTIQQLISCRQAKRGRLRGDVPHQRPIPPAGRGLHPLGMPYRLVGAQRFYGRREIKDLISYLRLAAQPGG